MNIDIMEKTEVYAAGAVAAVATFIISAKTRDVALWSCAIPFAIVFLGWLRNSALAKTIGLHNDYLISHQEKKFRPFLQWTTWYDAKREDERTQRRARWLWQSRLAAARLWFWIALGVLLLGLLWLTYSHAPFGGDDLVIKKYPI